MGDNPPRRLTLTEKAKPARIIKTREQIAEENKAREKKVRENAERAASVAAPASVLPQSLLGQPIPIGLPRASAQLPPLPPSGPSFFQNLTSAPTSASASASIQPLGPKSVSLHVPALSQGPQASGKLEAGPKIVRLVRKREDNGTLTYTATIVQSSMSEQLPKNTSWKTPGGVSVPALIENPLFNRSLLKGGRKRTHKRAHCAQSHKRK